LAVVIDLFARRIVGWATGDRLHRDLALAALRKALTMRRPAAGLIHHSDRGSQYCSIDYQAELRKHGILTCDLPCLVERIGSIGRPFFELSRLIEARAAMAPTGFVRHIDRRSSRPCARLIPGG